MFVCMMQTNETGKRERYRKPDPFFKAKKQFLKQQNRKQQLVEQEEQIEMKRKQNVEKRKKQKNKLLRRSKNGQPVLDHHVHHVLQKLKKSI